MKQGNNILNYITVLGFFGILAFPVLNSYMDIVSEADFEYSQPLPEKPEWNPENLDDYTDKFDQYFSQNFSLRTNYINRLNRWEYKLFGVSPKENLVITGKNGWMYAEKSRMHYENAYLFTPQSLKVIEEDLVARTRWCEERGIKYYTVIIPNKMNVYPEHLPRTIWRKSNRNRYDQFMSMANNPDLNIIGLRDVILKHKNDGRLLYQKTDDHWNEYGAYWGYQEIMKRVQKDFPDLKIKDVNDYTPTVARQEGNLAKKISLEKDYPEEMIYMVPKFKSKVTDGKKTGYKTDGGIGQWEIEMVKENPEGMPKKCLIIRDSFTLAMMKFVEETFAKTIFIHDEWRYRLRKDVIEKEKPDIVIVVLLESHAIELKNFPSF